MMMWALALPAGAQQRELKPGFNLFSKDQDIQLGKEAKAQVEKEMPVIRDAEIVNYVRGIGQRLAATPQAGGFPYTFDVVNDKNINAFALPGGPTFVNTGLIAAAENEAQLAGVMAHEISHVALRHGTNQASKANLIQLPAMLAGALAGRGGSMLGQLAQLGIGLGANSVLLKYSRNAERDADLLGARIMSEAGYNPVEMARFFEKLEAESGSRGLEFFSSHPNPGNRVKAVQQELQYLPQRQYSSSDARLRTIQARIGNLPAPPRAAAKSQQQAAAEPAEIRPSSQFRQYQGREFTMSYPDNWETFGDQQSAMVTIAPRKGIVQSGNSPAVGFGAIASFYFPQAQAADLTRDTGDLIRQLQASNPGMRVAGRSRRAQVSGLAALVTTLSSDSPFGGREVNLLVTVQRPDGIFYIVFIAPENEYRQAQPVYENMLRSVRFNR
jgi:hypothetical protein